MANLLANIPDAIPNEIFQDIVSTDTIRIERILSQGHSSPETGWYDQDENEWVLVLSGYGVIEFENGDTIKLKQGDYLNIKAHQKHKVQSTSPNETTVWLAIFY